MPRVCYFSAGQFGSKADVSRTQSFLCPTMLASLARVPQCANSLCEFAEPAFGYNLLAGIGLQVAFQISGRAWRNTGTAQVIEQRVQIANIHLTGIGLGNIRVSCSHIVHPAHDYRVRRLSDRLLWDGCDSGSSLTRRQVRQLGSQERSTRIVVNLPQLKQAFASKHPTSRG